MSEEDESAGKVHDATPRRLQQAREKGDIPRSADAQAAAAYAGLALALAISARDSAAELGAALQVLV
ncbi:MAG: EscU/YscU/HrcU family type III secretion system export apparatus switch protein, partial [Pseudomonadota bacterium]